MRERVLELHRQGKTIKEISEIVNRHQSTIRIHLNPDRREKSIKKISEHRMRIKKKAVDYSGGKCIRCGYMRCIDALTFHHINPNEKERSISSGCTRSWDKIKCEVDKTILLCFICHVEFHAKFWKLTNEVDKQISIRDTYKDIPLWHYGNQILANKIIKPLNKCKCGNLTKGKYCSHKCAQINSRKIIWPVNLRELVKVSSQRQVAKVLGVSDKAVAKHLKCEGESNG
jgi:hypothetical protein